MRTQRLQSLVKEATPEATEKAWALFEVLKASGATDVFHWNVMLRLCHTSARRRRVMEEMLAAGVQPNAATYNILASQLMFEGKAAEARAVVETEMPAAGVEPDDRTHAPLLRLPFC